MSLPLKKKNSLPFFVVVLDGLDFQKRFNRVDTVVGQHK